MTIRRTDSRPPIPDDIKRIVRQRCGFGCVICGHPLYEIDHIEEWSVVQKHEAHNLTLLCDEHHKEKTNKLLPVADVVAANANPKNLQTGHSRPYILKYSGDAMTVVFGSVVFKVAKESPFVIPLLIDWFPLLAFRRHNNALLLSAHLLNSKDELILDIQENELVYSTVPWDITQTLNSLVIRERNRKIFLDITFETPNTVIVNRAHFVRNGIEVTVDKERITTTGGITIGHSCIRSQFGIQLGVLPSSVRDGFRFPCKLGRVYGLGDIAPYVELGLDRLTETLVQDERKILT